MVWDKVRKEQGPTEHKWLVNLREAIEKKHNKSPWDQLVNEVRAPVGSSTQVVHSLANT